MPPAAISRSSTYFPKICGNIAPLYLSLLFATACGTPEPLEKKLLIRVHELPNCPLPRTAGGSLQSLQLELHALGDFRSSNLTAEFVALGGQGTSLGFPETTQAIEARITDGQRRFSGYAELRTDEGIDLLLWEEDRACSFVPAEGASYPAAGGGQALGLAPTLGLVFAAGGADRDNTSAIVGAISLDTRRGDVVVVDQGAQNVLRQPRAFASVSEFGAKLLVAGGENSLQAEDSREPLATAEVYDPVAKRFEPAPIELLVARTRHAALTLPSGDTLLIGGRSNVPGFNWIESVSVEDGVSRIAGLERLIGPRIEPKVLRLSDGRIFVGGGYTEGENPIALFEWFSPDASKSADTGLRSVVPAHFDRAFVAMPGGALLAVGGCEDRTAATVAEQTRCNAECRRGCPPLGGYDAFWVDADGGAEPVALPEGAIVGRPILLPGSDGAPWLVAVAAGSAETPPAPALYRFNPWTAAFTAAPSSIGLERLPSPNLPDPVSLGPDVFVWIDEPDSEMEPPAMPGLKGARLGLRGRYSDTLSLVVLADPFQPTRALHLAPDRFPGTAAVYDGTLTLSAEPQVTVYVTDTDYQNFTLRIVLSEGPPPLVVLGDAVFGDESCSWLEGGETVTGDNQPTLVRLGSSIELTHAGGRVRCAGPEGRVSVGVRGAGPDPTRIRQMEILRDP